MSPVPTLNETAQKRVSSFAQRYPGALDLACHAALPVVLDAEFVHLLRTNFFLDLREPLDFTAEVDFLLSPLCHEIGGGLYEIDPDVRDVLLSRLIDRHGTGRLREVATLLWQYTDRRSPWPDRPILERAQQLTALSFLDPRRARQWLTDVETKTGRTGLDDREWFVAMRREVESPILDALVPLNPLEVTLHLRHQFSGHKAWIHRLAWSSDGRTLASGSQDETIQLWDVETGVRRRILSGHADSVFSESWRPERRILALGSEKNTLSWYPDRQILASGSRDKTIRLWDADSGELLRTLEGHTQPVLRVAWSPNGKLLASGSADHTIQLWDPEKEKPLRSLEGHTGRVYSVAWSFDGRILASGSDDRTILLWDPGTGDGPRKLEGHTGPVLSLAWSPDDRLLASGSTDRTVRIWDPSTGRQLHVLEGHGDIVTSVFFSHDGHLLASKANDDTVRLWRRDTWEQVAELPEPSTPGRLFGLAFHPYLPVLATLGERNTVIRIWDLDLATLLGEVPTERSVPYTTAKVVLVGDSGVGKTSLGWRLAHDKFKAQHSTHGQQFWVLDSLLHRRADGTECEAVLWDLAGQPDYRLIHALSLDDADLVLVVFNPIDRQDPLHGVDFWLRALANRRGHPCHTILVGARTDIGEPMLTPAEIEAFCRGRGISGGYVATSARTGHGLDELIARMRGQILWEEMPVTVATTTFKRIKEYVLGLKEDPARTEVLIDPAGLRARLQALDPSWSFRDEEMMTAVGHLANHGYVRVLRTSSGTQAILLAPELLNNLVASFVLEARRHPEGLGALEEARVLGGEYAFPELAELSRHERETLLDAATVLFLEHTICFRESLGSRTFLIFPELINRKRPQVGEAETVDDVSYTVTGQVENVYAALVVLLGYTSVFTRTDQWRNQAQYEVGPGEVCAFRQSVKREGEIEFVLSYGPKVAETTRHLFEGLFEKILAGRRVSAMRYPPVVCPQCGDRQERATVVQYISQGNRPMYCSNCGQKITLPKAGEGNQLPRDVSDLVDQERATTDRRIVFETALVTVKALRKDAEAPRCFLSYAWDSPAHGRWVLALAKDLRKAGIDLIFDQWNPPGTSLAEFIEQIDTADFVLPVGTPKLLEYYQSKAAEHVVAAELHLIASLVMKRPEMRKRVIPLLRSGSQEASFPPLLRDRVPLDFRSADDYFARLIDLILTLYGIPFDSPAVAGLREKLRPDQEGVGDPDAGPTLPWADPADGSPTSPDQGEA
jgi:small GTP-binding protein